MSEDKDKAPERVWLTVFDDDQEPQFTMLEWQSPVVRNTQPGDFVATRPHRKIAYVPESKVRNAREEAFTAMGLELRRFGPNIRRVDLLERFQELFRELDRAAGSGEGG